MNKIETKQWGKLSEFIWTELEKEWPYFWSDDINELGIFLEQNCNINVGPEVLGKEVIIDKINMYLDSHCLSLSPLSDKYKDLEEDRNMFNNLDHDIHIDWYVGRGKNTFVIYEGINFKKDLKNHFEQINKYFGLSLEEAEVIAIFSGPNIQSELLKQANDCIKKEYEKFKNKWEPVVEKEIKTANNLLKDILGNRVFNEDGTIKKEILSV